MIYIESKSTNPYYNLALEEYVFNSINEDCFILWQNDNTIVVGKYQNTIDEINEKYVADHGIHVVRRLSGGGAVYHDLGNLNFTFISKQAEDNSFGFDRFTNQIIAILKGLGVNAKYNSRNDLVVGGKKFSGNSQYIKQGKILHHGTILFDSDLEVLSNALKANPAKIESKAIKSVHERVTNLKEFLPNDFGIEDLIGVMRNYIFSQNSVEYFRIKNKDEEKIMKLKNEKYATWEWNYGESPKFTIVREGKRDSGFFQVKMNVVNGYISDIKFYGDFFVLEEINSIEEEIVGTKYSREEMADKVLKMSKRIIGMDHDWLLNTLLFP